MYIAPSPSDLKPRYVPPLESDVTLKQYMLDAEKARTTATLCEQDKARIRDYVEKVKE